MARSIRIEYPGAYYHTMARGNRREEIYRDDEDRLFFLKTLSEACAMTGWRVHAWVLMSNHYHLLLETPEANLVTGMQWLQNTYTRRFNLRHKLWGRVFGDRYKSVLVEGASAYYYETLVDYIHLNPVRAGIIQPNSGGSAADYQWSSLAGGYLWLPERRPAWLAAEHGLRTFGFEDTVEGRRGFLERLDKRAREEAAERGGVPIAAGDRRLSDLRRGWYWGTQTFAEKALKLGEMILKKNRHRDYQASHESRAHGEKDALEIIEKGLIAAGLTREMLERLPGSDTRKVSIAREIWEKTTMNMKWIAKHLAMKSATNASQQIRRHKVRDTL